MRNLTAVAFDRIFQHDSSIRQHQTRTRVDLIFGKHDGVRASGQPALNDCRCVGRDLETCLRQNYFDVTAGVTAGGEEQEYPADREDRSVARAKMDNGRGGHYRLRMATVRLCTKKMRT